MPRLPSLAHLPILIDAPGLYRTRGCQLVSIAKIHDGWAIGRWYSPASKFPEQWDVSGRFMPDTLTSDDIVSKIISDVSHE